MSDLKSSLQSDSSKFFRLQDGPNKLRIVTELYPVARSFDKEAKTSTLWMTQDGAKSDKDAKRRFACYVLNRDQGNALQFAELPVSVVKQLFELSTNNDYKFDDIPPYDVTVTKTGTGMDTKYSLVAARANTELTAEEKALVESAKSVFNTLKETAADAENAIPF